jgi:hypothetical protein
MLSGVPVVLWAVEGVGDWEARWVGAGAGEVGLGTQVVCI